jgi:hypothetical protein
MLVRVGIVLFFAMWRPGAAIPKRAHERHRRAMSLLSVGALTSAKEVDCSTKERDSGCDADGYADVGGCREVAAGR